MIFKTQTMQEILPLLQEVLQEKESCVFTVLNPDLYDNAYAGTACEVGAEVYLYRSYKAWGDLAELLKCKMQTPKIVNASQVEITFKKLQNSSFHSDKKSDEKYGMDSSFAQIHKMEEPTFLYSYLEALTNVKVETRRRILNLGINRGDEFEVIKKKLDTKKYQELEFVGIDHSKSAIAHATEQFSKNNHRFYAHDIQDLDALKLGQFDLLISIGTLQSPSIDFKPFFMSLVQNYLKKDSAIILGFPNARWLGGEMLYGAKVPNYAMSEMGHLYNDVMFCKKYLQQKKYRVTLTGKQYVFLTATKLI